MDPAFRQRPVLVGPRLDVVGRQLRVRIAIRLGADVDHGERRDQILDREFADALAVSGEMQWRVDMGAGVLDNPPLRDVEAVLGEVVQLVDEELLAAEIGRKILDQIMGEIFRLGRGLRQHGRGNRRNDGARRSRSGNAGEETAPAEHAPLDAVDDAMMAHCRDSPRQLVVNEECSGDASPARENSFALSPSLENIFDMHRPAPREHGHHVEAQRQPGVVRLARQPEVGRASMRRSEARRSPPSPQSSVGRAFTSTISTRSPRRAIRSISPSFVR
jgi:hypothetical protein